MTGFIFVGLGGALGAMLRYAIGLVPYKGTFPLLTLLINIAGAVLIGYITGIAVKKNLSPNVILLLKTGVCGGFTTFSTFSLEAYNLFQNGNYALMGLYILLSLAGSFIGVWFGTIIA